LIDKKIADPAKIGIQGHSWGGYQVAYVITQTNMFKCACTETAVANMTSAYSGLRAGPGKTRMFMYESTQSRIGGSLWEKKDNYIENSPVFYLDKVTTPLLSRHSDGDEAVPFTQGLELFLGLKRLGKPVWMFNYKGDGHNIKKREIAEDWTRRMDQFFDYYLLDKEKPNWM
ncbi:MAG: alpha/beta hydrolase family protein, partial [Bacteroidales bacterium]